MNVQHQHWIIEGKIYRHEEGYLIVEKQFEEARSVEGIEVHVPELEMGHFACFVFL